MRPVPVPCARAECSAARAGPAATSADAGTESAAALRGSRPEHAAGAVARAERAARYAAKCVRA